MRENNEIGAMGGKVQKSLCARTPQESTNIGKVARQFSRYVLTGGCAACRLVLADPSFTELMETDDKCSLFSHSSQFQTDDKITQTIRR